MDKLNFTFSIMISYFCPGIIGLYSIAPFSYRLSALLIGKNGGPATASLLPITALGLALGMAINAASAATIRQIFKRMGTKAPSAEDYSKLSSDKLPVYERIVDTTYKYFECYSNMSMAIVIFLISRLLLQYSSFLEKNRQLFINISVLIILITLLRAAYRCFNIYSIRIRNLLNQENKKNN